MRQHPCPRRVAGVLLAVIAAAAGPAAAQEHGLEPSHQVARLVAAMLGGTPLPEDVRALSDEIGGRATGSDENLEAVEWALGRFRAAGVQARREAFRMPGLWLERSARGRVTGDGIGYDVRLAAMPFSTPTPPEGVTAPLLDVGSGSPEDFTRLGSRARGAFLLVETELLEDIEGLFAEYASATQVEARAREASAAGVVYMSSRASGILYRHNASLTGDDARPMMIMERDRALRTLRLLRAGHRLRLTAVLDLRTGGPYESYNVIGEIPGAENPEEIVVVGAHLDSWDLGAGTLDNGANVSMLIDLARQMQRLDIRPRRTVRIALWNGEEQGLNGSWGYVKSHADELDRHVMAASFDIGCGRINGFFTGGRPEMVPAVEAALEPVEGLGPFELIDVPIVGTDNYDFMMEGVANLVGNQESATYGPNYHASSDQLDECDIGQLRMNGAIVAAVVLGFANMDVTWGRQTAAQVEALVESTDLGQQMRDFGLWDAWEKGIRGRRTAMENPR